MAAEYINAIYQHTRTYLPKVLSARRLISKLEETGELVRVLDDFLSIILVQGSDINANQYCIPPLRWIMENNTHDEFFGTREDNFGRAFLNVKLRKISYALDRISDVITELKMRSGQYES